MITDMPTFYTASCDIPDLGIMKGECVIVRWGANPRATHARELDMAALTLHLDAFWAGPPLEPATKLVRRPRPLRLL